MLAPVGIFARFDQSDPDNVRGPVVVLRVTGCFAGEPPLRSKIVLIVCGGFSCGHQEAEGETHRDPQNFFLSAQKSHRNAKEHLVDNSCRRTECRGVGWDGLGGKRD
jgi:hypothetical protein